MLTWNVICKIAAILFWHQHVNFWCGCCLWIWSVELNATNWLMGGGMHWRTVRIENMKPTKVKVSKSYLHSHHTHEYHNSWQWPSQGVFYLINSVLAIIMNVWIKSFKSHPCWKDITAVIIWNYLALRTELLIFIFNDVLVLISHIPFNYISSHQIWR